MDFTEMTTAQLLERRTAIVAELDSPSADLDALEQEARDINAEIERRRNDERRRNTLRNLIAADGINVDVQRTFGASGNPCPVPVAASPEYRRAWLKNLAVRQDTPIFGEMTAEERTAFTHSTVNSGSVVPTVIMNRIVELVESMSPMLTDATHSNIAQGFGVPRHKAITKGDAIGTAEGAANPDDEQDDFDLLSLDGIEIKKHVVVTRKMQFKSIDAFENWLVDHLAQRIAVGKEKVILARLDGTAPTGGSVISGSGIDAANILTAQTYTDATIRSIFAKLKGDGARVVYANNATIWNHLFGIEDSEGRKLFIPNSMGDPVIQGRIYGAAVKVDENLADNVAYFGAEGAVLANDYEDLFIFATVEPKTANTIQTAYSLFDAGLENPKAFVKATFAPSATSTT